MAALNSRRQTYLDLCNRVLKLTDENGYRERSSLKEFDRGTQLIPLHVQDAWNDVARTRDDWKFLRQDNFVTAPLKPGVNEQEVEYLLGSGAKNSLGELVDMSHRFSHWNESGQFFTIEGGLQRLAPALIDYDDIRKYASDPYGAGTISYISLMPNDNIFVWPKPPPGRETRLRVDFYKRPNALVNEDDITDLPIGTESVIVWRAMMMHGGNEQDTIRDSVATVFYTKQMSNLERTEAPTIRVRAYGV